MDIQAPNWPSLWYFFFRYAPLTIFFLYYFRFVTVLPWITIICQCWWTSGKVSIQYTYIVKHGAECLQDQIFDPNPNQVCYAPDRDPTWLGLTWTILLWKRLTVDTPPATRVVKFLRPKVLLAWWINTHRPANSNICVTSCDVTTSCRDVTWCHVVTSHDITVP